MFIKHMWNWLLRVIVTDLLDQYYLFKIGRKLISNSLNTTREQADYKINKPIILIG